MATRAKPEPRRRGEAPGGAGAAAAPAASVADAPGAAEDDSVAEERGPLRRCVVTRARQPKEAMLRFVLSPERVLVPDLAGRLPGRGMWLSAKADVLERALARGAFAKAARGPVHAPPDLRAMIEAGLRHRIRDLLGFARRAGQAVCGFHAVREWLQAGRAGMLVEASDGSAAERARLLGGREVRVTAPLPAAELGAVFGRDHVVHAAVATGRLAEAIGMEASRLAGLAAGGAVGTDASRAARPARGAGIGYESADE